MMTHIPDYPRPMLQRANWTSLDGEWEFAFDDSNEGMKHRWQRGFKMQHMIQVPFTYETKLSGIHEETFHPVVWYHRTVRIHQEAVADGHRVLLHFEGSDFRTIVWVNGERCGSHEGGYERFSFDVTPYVTVGESEITVRVEDSMDPSQPRGKQRWIRDSFACWYVQTTGIWKSVWIESVPDVYLEHLKLTPDLHNGRLEVEAMIGGLQERDVRMRPVNSLTEDADKQTEMKKRSLHLCASFDKKRAGDVTVEVTGPQVHAVIDLSSTDITPLGIMEWSPETPNLYDLEAEILEDGCSADKVCSYFGMREIRIDNGIVLLNGKPLYQRLILDQGYWKDSGLTPPDEQALINDIDKIRRMGFNGLRKHQKTEDERFLYWCDAKGMLVWSETPAAYEFSERAQEYFTKEWMALIRQNYSHPCVIVWTPFNESWGVRQVETDYRQQQFTEGIYHLTKAYDPFRPVVSNDGWEHTVTDLVTLHDYVEKGEDFLEHYLNHKDEILSTQMYHSKEKSAFANGYTYSGQPVLISEYGGIAFGGHDGEWGYGNTVRDEDEFLARYDAITTAIKKVPWICGFCYTQVSDVQQEINGLMDMNRNFKVDPDKIREINLR